MVEVWPCVKFWKVTLLTILHSALKSSNTLCSSLLKGVHDHRPVTRFQHDELIEAITKMEQILASDASRFVLHLCIFVNLKAYRLLLASPTEEDEIDMAVKAMEAMELNGQRMPRLVLHRDFNA